MNWTRVLLAVVAAGFLASITDWIFMGMLFHNKYMESREAWRGEPGQSELPKILKSTLLGTLGSAMFIMFCHVLAVHSAMVVLHMALFATLLGPLPVIFSNVVWMKFHPLLGVSHSLGWFVRFVIAGLCAVWLM